MTNELRTVLDTGVVISATLLAQSVPRQAFDAAKTHGRLLASDDTISELEAVFRRTKFNKYIPEALRLEFLAALVREAELIEITERIQACRDPKDDMFLELAVSGRATHVISGDGDLLALHPFRGIPVVSPRGFLDLATVKERAD